MSTRKTEGSNHTYTHVKTEPCPGESKAKLHALIATRATQSHKERVKSLISRASSMAAGKEPSAKGLKSIVGRTFKS